MLLFARGIPIYATHAASCRTSKVLALISSPASLGSMKLILVACFLSVAEALVASPGMLQVRSRSAPVVMAGPKGWPDFKETQVEAFERGGDYIFFQGPKPKTGYQADLPSFFSPDNFADLEITPTQIAVTITGIGSAGILAASLLGIVPLPA